MARDPTAKSLPWSEEAERATLGGILLDADNNFPKVTAILRSRDFYHPVHRAIFSAFLEMRACGVPIDVVTLKDSLRGVDDVDKAGGPVFIVQLTDGLAAAENFDYYAEMVKQKSIERRMLSALNNAETAYLSGNGHIDSALRDLRSVLEEVEPSEQRLDTASWRTVCCDNPEDWRGIPPIEWCCEQIIPRNSLGFVGGGPKDGKSVLMLDLMIHMAHALYEPLGSIKFLDRFIVHGQRVFYVSKEDGMERLFQRWPDINQAYGYEDPPPGLTIVPRKLSAFMLTEPTHIRWLEDQISRTESTFLTLDVFSELIPGIDEMKEIRQALDILKDLRDRLNISIAVIDHTRKAPVTNTKFKSTNQDLDPMEIRGAYKFGAADWTMMVGSGPEANTMKLSIRCKDAVESIQGFVIKRSPIGTVGKPKHEIESTIDDLASRSHESGAANLEAVYAAVNFDWQTTEIIAEHVPSIKTRTVRKHLDKLMREGKVERGGRGRNIAYRRVSDTPAPPLPGQLY